MDNLNLINSTFRRIYEIASMSGLVIKELPSGGVHVRIIKNDITHLNPWEWENKEQFLISDDNEVSLFLFLTNVYQSSYLKDKINLNFINLCKTLKGCESIEELIIKMDLMGI
jgi:hypothetical protein